MNKIKGKNAVRVTVRAVKILLSSIAVYYILDVRIEELFWIIGGIVFISILKRTQVQQKKFFSLSYNLIRTIFLFFYQMAIMSIIFSVVVEWLYESVHRSIWIPVTFTKFYTVCIMNIVFFFYFF